MKIAYVASLAHSNFSGVVRKINCQLAVWNSLPNVQAQLFCRTGANLNLPAAQTYKLKDSPTFSLNLGLLRDLILFKPDIVYLRHELCGPQIMLLLAIFGKKVVLEINSNIYSELYAEGQKSPRRRLAFYYNALTEKIYSRINACVFVTNELSRLPLFRNIPHKLIVPNSILLDDHIVCKKTDNSQNTTFIFAGTPGQIWHGVDLILPLAQKTEKNFVFHIVGPQPIPDAPKNMIFHSYIAPQQLKKLYAQSHIGLGSLAVHRKKMTEATPLKVREYLAAGLPVIIAYNDTAFSENCPPWVLQLPAGEKLFSNAKNVDAVLNFVQTYRDFAVPHKESAPYIDAKILEQKKIDWLRTICHKKEMGKQVATS